MASSSFEASRSQSRCQGRYLHCRAAWAKSSRSLLKKRYSARHCPKKSQVQWSLRLSKKKMSFPCNDFISPWKSIAVLPGRHKGLIGEHHHGALRSKGGIDQLLSAGHRNGDGSTVGCFWSEGIYNSFGCSRMVCFVFLLLFLLVVWVVLYIIAWECWNCLYVVLWDFSKRFQKRLMARITFPNLSSCHRCPATTCKKCLLSCAGKGCGVTFSDMPYLKGSDQQSYRKRKKHWATQTTQFVLMKKNKSRKQLTKKHRQPAPFLSSWCLFNINSSFDKTFYLKSSFDLRLRLPTRAGLPEPSGRAKRSPHRHTSALRS